ncbi:MAG: hypothetical protein KDD58_06900 [Bdellovibrionales bacterium]|nr:hypothetical protein [Bdellovibrionales bacterium]
MSQQPPESKNSNYKMPQKITEARESLKMALSEFEKIIVHEKIQEDEKEVQARKHLLLKLKSLLADLS